MPKVIHGLHALLGTDPTKRFPRALQFMAMGQRTGTLYLRNVAHDLGKVHLREGMIVGASMNELDRLSTTKCIFRMLAWRSGDLWMDALEARAQADEPPRHVDDVLAACLAQLEGFDLLLRGLPDLETRLVRAQPNAPTPRPLTEEDLVMLRLFEEHGQLETVLNESETTDADSVRIILGLIEGAYLRPA